MPDCALYNPVWFIQQHLGVAASPLDRLPRIVVTRTGRGKCERCGATDAARRAGHECNFVRKPSYGLLPVKPARPIRSGA